MAQPKKDDRSQVKAFRRAARELGCDEDEGRFQTALRTLAKAKPKVRNERYQKVKPR